MSYKSVKQRTFEEFLSKNFDNSPQGRQFKDLILKGYMMSDEEIAEYNRQYKEDLELLYNEVLPMSYYLTNTIEDNNNIKIEEHKEDNDKEKDEEKNEENNKLLSNLKIEDAK